MTPRDPKAWDEFGRRGAPHAAKVGVGVVLVLGGPGAAVVVGPISADEQHLPVQRIELEGSGGGRSYDTTPIRVPVSFAQGTLTGSSTPPR
jgi:hypothetical protein